jgi:hypothetical protein
MRRTEFNYRVEATLEVHGIELALLQFAAQHHYDTGCKRAFAQGGFGYGWINRFLAEDESFVDLDIEHMDLAIADRTVEVQASSREIDLLRKCLEFYPHNGMQQTANTKVVRRLQDALAQAFQDIQTEFVRLNGEGKHL